MKGWSRDVSVSEFSIPAIRMARNEKGEKFGGVFTGDRMIFDEIPRKKFSPLMVAEKFR